MKVDTLHTVDSKYIPNLLKLGILGSLAVGLTLLCHPDEIRRHLEGGLRNTFDNLLRNSNEREDAWHYVRQIPDGKGQDAAGMVNAATRYAPTKRRYMNEKVTAKPHLAVLDGLRAAASIFRR